MNNIEATLVHELGKHAANKALDAITRISGVLPDDQLKMATAIMAMAHINAKLEILIDSDPAVCALVEQTRPVLMEMYGKRYADIIKKEPTK